MIIGIDASRAFLANRTGIEEYSYQLIKYLRRELAEERVVLYVRATNNRQQTTNNKQSITDGIDFELPEKWEVRELWAPRFWTQGRLAIEMLFHPVDVLFVPAHTVPWIHPKRTVVVVHGLEYEFCPETYSLWERIYMRWSIRNSCRWASMPIIIQTNNKDCHSEPRQLAGKNLNLQGIIHALFSTNPSTSVGMTERCQPNYIIMSKYIDKTYTLCYT